MPFSLRGPGKQGSREAVLIVTAAIALYFLLSLASYHPADPGWSHSADTKQVFNQGGPVGAWVADVFLYLFGYWAYLFPVLFGFLGWHVFQARGTEYWFDKKHMAVRGAGFLLTLAAGSGLATLHFAKRGELPLDSGGILGDVVGNGLVTVFSSLGGTVLLLALFLTGVTLLTSLSWLAVMDSTGRYTLMLFDAARQSVSWIRVRLDARRVRKERETHVEKERKRSKKRRKPKVEPTIAQLAPSVRVEKERQVPLFEATGETELPPLALLDAPKDSGRNVSESALEAVSRQVEMKLMDFGIEVAVVAVHPGPVVTRFELEPAPGMKVSRITALVKDLARSL